MGNTIQQQHGKTLIQGAQTVVGK